MLLGELCKVLCETKLDIVVFDNTKFVESFQVNYLAKGVNDNILKKIDLIDLNAVVTNVTVNCCTGVLTITVRV